MLGARYPMMMGAHPDATTSLGPAEAQLHDALTAAGQQVNSLLDSLRNAPQVPPRMHMNRIDRQIRDLQAQMRECIRDLELLGEEQDTEEEAHAVDVVLRAHKANYESLRHAVTAAQLLVKQRGEATFAQQRKELLSGASVSALQRKYKHESDVVEGAQAITNGLTKAIRELEQTIGQQEDTKELLATGNAVLSQTTGVLHDQKHLFKESDRKLKALKWQATGDRWLLWMGLLLFVTVAAYVGYKRAPAPIKMPLDAAFRLGSHGVSFTLRQVGAGLSLALRQARQLSSSTDKADPAQAGSTESSGTGLGTADSWTPPPSQPSSPPSPSHPPHPLRPSHHGDSPLLPPSSAPPDPTAAAHLAGADGSPGADFEPLGDRVAPPAPPSNVPPPAPPSNEPPPAPPSNVPPPAPPSNEPCRICFTFLVFNTSAVGQPPPPDALTGLSLEQHLALACQQILQSSDAHQELSQPGYEALLVFGVDDWFEWGVHDEPPASSITACADATAAEALALSSAFNHADFKTLWSEVGYGDYSCNLGLDVTGTCFPRALPFRSPPCQPPASKPDAGASHVEASAAAANHASEGAVGAEGAEGSVLEGGLTMPPLPVLPPTLPNASVPSNLTFIGEAAGMPLEPSTVYVGSLGDSAADLNSSAAARGSRAGPAAAALEEAAAVVGRMAAAGKGTGPAGAAPVGPQGTDDVPGAAHIPGSRPAAAALEEAEAVIKQVAAGVQGAGPADVLSGGRSSGGGSPAAAPPHGLPPPPQSFDDVDAAIRLMMEEVAGLSRPSGALAVEGMAHTEEADPTAAAKQPEVLSADKGRRQGPSDAMQPVTDAVGGEHELGDAADKVADAAMQTDAEAPQHSVPSDAASQTAGTNSMAQESAASAANASIQAVGPIDAALRDAKAVIEQEVAAAAAGRLEPETAAADPSTPSPLVDAALQSASATVARQEEAAAPASAAAEPSLPPRPVATDVSLPLGPVDAALQDAAAAIKQAAAAAAVADEHSLPSQPVAPEVSFSVGPLDAALRDAAGAIQQAESAAAAAAAAAVAAAAAEQSVRLSGPAEAALVEASAAIQQAEAARAAEAAAAAGGEAEHGLQLEVDPVAQQPTDTATAEPEDSPPSRTVKERLEGAEAAGPGDTLSCPVGGSGAATCSAVEQPAIAAAAAAAAADGSAPVGTDSFDASVEGLSIEDRTEGAPAGGLEPAGNAADAAQQDVELANREQARAVQQVSRVSGRDGGAADVAGTSAGQQAQAAGSKHVQRTPRPDDTQLSGLVDVTLQDASAAVEQPARADAGQVAAAPMAEPSLPVAPARAAADVSVHFGPADAALQDASAAIRQQAEAALQQRGRGAPREPEEVALEAPMIAVAAAAGAAAEQQGGLGQQDGADLPASAPAEDGPDELAVAPAEGGASGPAAVPPQRSELSAAGAAEAATSEDGLAPEHGSHSSAIFSDASRLRDAAAAKEQQAVATEHSLSSEPEVQEAEAGGGQAVAAAADAEGVPGTNAAQDLTLGQADAALRDGIAAVGETEAAKHLLPLEWVARERADVDAGEVAASKPAIGAAKEAAATAMAVAAGADDGGDSGSSSAPVDLLGGVPAEGLGTVGGGVLRGSSMLQEHDDQPTGFVDAALGDVTGVMERQADAAAAVHSLNPVASAEVAHTDAAAGAEHSMYGGPGLATQRRADTGAAAESEHGAVADTAAVAGGASKHMPAPLADLADAMSGPVGTPDQGPHQGLGNAAKHEHDQPLGFADAAARYATAALHQQAAEELTGRGLHPRPKGSAVPSGSRRRTDDAAPEGRALDLAYVAPEGVVGLGDTAVTAAEGDAGGAVASMPSQIHGAAGLNGVLSQGKEPDADAATAALVGDAGEAKADTGQQLPTADDGAPSSPALPPPSSRPLARDSLFAEQSNGAMEVQQLLQHGRDQDSEGSVGEASAGESGEARDLAMLDATMASRVTREPMAELSAAAAMQKEVAAAEAAEDLSEGTLAKRASQKSGAAEGAVDGTWGGVGLPEGGPQLSPEAPQEGAGGASPEAMTATAAVERLAGGKDIAAEATHTQGEEGASFVQEDFAQAWDAAVQELGEEAVE